MPNKITAEFFVLARISGGNYTRIVPIDVANPANNPDKDPNHLLIPLFDYAKNYYDLLNGPYVKTPVEIEVSYANQPQPDDYFNALQPFIESKFLGYTIDKAGVFSGISYWDGRRWIRPGQGQVSFAYPFKPKNSAVIKQAVWVDDDAGNEVSLILDFLAVIQHG